MLGRGISTNSPNVINKSANKHPKRGQCGIQTDSLSWVLHALRALSVSPNKDSKTPTRKTEEKNSYINTCNSAVSQPRRHTHDLQCVYSRLERFCSLILYTVVTYYTNHVLWCLSIISRGRTNRSGYKSLTKPPNRHAQDRTKRFHK